MAEPRKRSVDAELNSVLSVLEEENWEGVFVKECDSDVSSDESFNVSEDSDVVMAIRKKSLIPFSVVCYAGLHKHEIGK
jgi:hypothetical protein